MTGENAPATTTWGKSGERGTSEMAVCVFVCVRVYGKRGRQVMIGWKRTEEEKRGGTERMGKGTEKEEEGEGVTANGVGLAEGRR